MSEHKNKTSHEPTDQVIHVYDGIEEQDNHLPRWWLATFFGAILFSGLYIGYYWIGNGPTLDEEYQRDRLALAVSVAYLPKSADELTEDAVLAAANNKDADGKGDSLFQPRCASCHGTKGEGGIGPNLTDRSWIHGKNPKDWLTVIQKGVLDKGMPPWEAALSKSDMLSLVGYIASIQGSNPPQAKAPQGVE